MKYSNCLSYCFRCCVWLDLCVLMSHFFLVVPTPQIQMLMVSIWVIMLRDRETEESLWHFDVNSKIILFAFFISKIVNICATPNALGSIQQLETHTYREIKLVNYCDNKYASATNCGQILEFTICIDLFKYNTPFNFRFIGLPQEIQLDVSDFVSEYNLKTLRTSCFWRKFK